MSASTSLKRFRSPIQPLYLIRQLQARQYSNPASSSSSPLSMISTSTTKINSQLKNVTQFSFSRWFSGFAVGSGVGLCYWTTNSSSDSESALSFSDLPTPTTGKSEIENQESSSSFAKLSLPDYSSSFIFGDAYRRRIFFNYEKRIRLRSPPEKVFEYFASFRASNGELLMTPADMMRAVVPVFPPSESNLVREGYLSGERRSGELRCSPSEFFMLFDVDNDGLISFKEYIFFVTLLSIPESAFSVAFKMFDVDHSGEIDKEEFKKVMALMRTHNRQGAVHRDGRRTGLRVSGSVEDGGLLEYFFGKDGNGRLQHDKFVTFLGDLQDEMLRLEFAHYDYKSQKTISAKDFALSMVASADLGHLNKFLDRVEEINNAADLREIRITFEEFKDFAEIRKSLQPLSLALFSYGKINGLLTREDFQRAASHVCGVSLTDNVVDIIFYMFDSNRDGHLSAEEFVRVLHKREKDTAQPANSGITGFLSCCSNCGNGNPFRQFFR
ncbi:calcium uptake protein, mitochondrial-like [Euphorbia lathyris]|uniref:calcium uptake protein, mitochondrial-like n=1 Tax=Euphorbia lathyris TaxID=212925 RepID=UPI0033132A79